MAGDGGEDGRARGGVTYGSESRMSNCPRGAPESWFMIIDRNVRGAAKSWRDSHSIVLDQHVRQLIGESLVKRIVNALCASEVRERLIVSHESDDGIVALPRATVEEWAGRLEAMHHGNALDVDTLRWMAKELKEDIKRRARCRAIQGSAELTFVLEDPSDG
jgi:hypothetical protein